MPARDRFEVGHCQDGRRELAREAEFRRNGRFRNSETQSGAIGARLARRPWANCVGMTSSPSLPVCSVGAEVAPGWREVGAHVARRPSQGASV